MILFSTIWLSCQTGENVAAFSLYDMRQAYQIGDTDAMLLSTLDISISTASLSGIGLPLGILWWSGGRNTIIDLNERRTPPFGLDLKKAAQKGVLRLGGF